MFSVCVFVFICLFVIYFIIILPLIFEFFIIRMWYFHSYKCRCIFFFFTFLLYWLLPLIVVIIIVGWLCVDGVSKKFVVVYLCVAWIRMMILFWISKESKIFLFCPLLLIVCKVCDFHLLLLLSSVIYLKNIRIQIMIVFFCWWLTSISEKKGMNLPLSDI